MAAATTSVTISPMTNRLVAPTASTRGTTKAPNARQSTGPRGPQRCPLGDGPRTRAGPRGQRRRRLRTGSSTVRREPACPRRVSGVSPFGEILPSHKLYTKVRRAYRAEEGPCQGFVEGMYIHHRVLGPRHAPDRRVRRPRRREPGAAAGLGAALRALAAGAVSRAGFGSTPTRTRSGWPACAAGSERGAVGRRGRTRRARDVARRPRACWSTPRRRLLAAIERLRRELPCRRCWTRASPAFGVGGRPCAV